MKTIRMGAAALAASALLTAAACGNGGTADTASGEGSGSASQSGTQEKPVTLKFYSYNLAIASQVEGTKKLISEFEAAHPTIKIDAVPVASTDINAKVQADIVAGTAPDVAQLTFDGLDFAVNNFNAKPLEDFVPADEMAENFKDFSPNGLKLGQLNGKTYGLPFTFSTPVLFYNADLFRKAGLDPDQPPKTWEEVKQAGLAIKEKTGEAGAIINGASGGDWIIQAVIGSNGGSVLSDDRKTITFGEPEAVGAIRMWQDMIQSGASNKMNQGEAMEAFSQGKTGMLLFTSALQSSFLASAKAGGWELRTAKMPAFDGKPTTPVNSGSALFVLSDDKAKQQAAWQFLKFVTSKRGYTIITSEIGYLPLRPSIVDDPEYLKGWVEENPLVKPNLEQLETLRPWVSYPGSNWKQVETLLQDAVSKSILGKEDPAAILQDAANRAQALIQ
ncbi:multiple sugar transport system substrate-binding protein [Paenibacillus sp. RU4T]|uniref:ABC transporter substrate-binding protein n=1 Tax=unclassified Paenibacillus TaxID=185978 RepID=UPI0009540FEA|nr:MULTISPECIES: ABC transporter substrate-binding protein [unclassified Paenibacillus]SIQ12940.1 multiple sugar transport system substrate-binding protein [Paenibacillus sp. RU4X]SIQ34692.1 multiple sugar transport system substrate-binding protein [Paenibacillus sp. RU4T]